MDELVKKKRKLATEDRMAFLIANLHKMGKYTNDSKPLESLKLVDLENLYIEEKCRMTAIKQIQGEFK